MTENSSFVALVGYTSKLVKQWEASILSTGKSLGDSLNIKGICLWAVMEVNFALYRVPNLLSEVKKKSGIRENLVSILKVLNFHLKKLFKPRYLPLSKHTSPDLLKSECVLFLGFSWYLSRDVMLPIAKQLASDQVVTPIFLVEKFQESMGNLESRIKFISIARFRTKAIRDSAIDFAKQSERKVMELVKQNEFYRVFRATCSVNPKKLQKELSRFLIGAAYSLADTWALANHILRKSRPVAVVSIDCADPRTRIFMQVARSIGISTVQIQAGPIDDGCAEWKFFNDDLILAQGNMTREILIRHGVATEKILVTGSPRYDELFPASVQEIQDLRARFEIPKTSKIIVLASTYSLSAFGDKAEVALDSMKRALFDCISNFPDVWLIVKPHPLENIKRTEALVSNYANIVFADKSENIRPYISACDAFISFGSTATYEALILNKPTVCIRYEEWGELVSEFLANSEALEIAKTPEEVLQAVNEISKDCGEAMLNRVSLKRKEFLKSIIFIDDKSASNKISEILTSLRNKFDHI